MAKSARELMRPWKHDGSIPENQVCTKCLVNKPKEAFGIRLERGYLYRQCRDCMKARKWAKRNPEKQLALNRAWIDKNRERARKIWRDMRSKRLRRNPAVRLHGRISNQIWMAINGRKNGRSTFETLQYSKEELVSHLERQFLKGMSWENMGEWHIDHILPLASFTLNDDADIRRAWALTNLRPLWAVDNMRKGARVETLL